MLTDITHLYDAHPEFVRTLVRKSERLGSNDGGLFESPLGQWIYLKQYHGPNAVDRLKNEKLGAELYKLAGVPHADVRLTEWNGEPALASRWIDGRPLSEFKKADFDKITGLQENWPVDAWLANWDVTGRGLKNIIVDDRGVAHRIDAGSGLRYRANGKLKTHADDGREQLEGLQDPRVTPGASKVFGKLDPDPDDPSFDGALRLAQVPEDQIRALVDRYGPSSPTAKRRLLRDLIDRKHDIARAYGLDRD